MRKMTLTIFLIAIFTTCHAPEHRTLYIQQEAGIQPFEMIWRAVCWVESENNPLAFNKKELAYGIAQIRYIRLHDYNKKTGKRYTLSMMYDVKKSKEVFMFYARQFSDYDEMIRSWNGSGRKTYSYLGKVKNRLNNQYWQSIKQESK